MPRRMTPLLCLVALLIGPITSANAQSDIPDPHRLINAQFIEQTRQWLSNPIVNMSVRVQSERHSDLDQNAIDALDQQWRNERGTEDQPLIAATLSSPLSSYLTRIQAGSIGLYTEIFVVDEKGLNVGQSATSSDYWQGDEAKYQQTFSVGPDAIFIDEAEWDEDRQIWRAQLNLSIPSEDGSQAIGAATVEINLTELQRRTHAGI